MKLSSAITLLLLTSSLLVASCNSNSDSSQGSSSKETAGTSSQEQKRDDGPRPGTPVQDEDANPADDHITASKICDLAFTQGTNSYFETYNEQQNFKEFLREMRLKVGVETCKSFDDISFSISPKFVNFYDNKNRGKWLNDFLPYMSNVTDLIITDKSVSDISNIRFLNGLNLLILRNTSVSDLSALKNLSNLDLISLDNTEITNESLQTLPSRRNVIEGYSLSIGHNPQITDISGLTKAKGALRGLSLRGNINISDFSPLATLGRLSNLDLSRTTISESDLDLYVTSKLQFMRELNLAGTEISNIDGLKKLGKLEKLNLTNTRVTNLDALEKLENLKDLYLSKEQLNTLDLSRLPKHIKPAILTEIW